MAMNNVAILNFGYNYIYKNKQGFSNRVPIPNTDPFSNYRPLKIIVV